MSSTRGVVYCHRSYRYGDSVYVFVTGMNAEHQRFYLTLKPPSSLEEVFTIAIREVFSVIAYHMEHSSYLRAG